MGNHNNYHNNSIPTRGYIYMKITYTIGSEDKLIQRVTIEDLYHNHSSDDLQEYLARYFSRHGGMKWSVKKE